MQRVTGLGGVLFRARDPRALAGGYAEHLGSEKFARSPKDWMPRLWQSAPNVFPHDRP